MKKIHIILFGVGNVGSALINQILEGRDMLKKKSKIELNIPIVANSTATFFEEKCVRPSWETDFKYFGFTYKMDEILTHIKREGFKNVIIVDATASEDFIKHYPTFIKNGFDIVASNKSANTASTSFYKRLRRDLKKYKTQFLYETNVGAGLPIIETLQRLHASGEKVVKVRGVFSGSMSYVFNEFSQQDKMFDSLLAEAGIMGLTERDPRIDLSGMDVAGKLLILARELQLQKELSDVKIENLVPKHLSRYSSVTYFKNNLRDLNIEFDELKEGLKSGEVLRHIGELDVQTGTLEVKLVKENKNSAIGSLKNTDASFEIFTASNGAHPIIIQGAGAGSIVAARGVLADITKLAEKFTR
ncbi:homoserine dehydrogenase family protein [Gillisia marina]|uniref:aspartokinase n=1 Tax=Gillisia marina TaxID=1167637 RepID=UPI00029A99BE|nr:aspartokinase [Gillisia marina]